MDEPEKLSTTLVHPIPTPDVSVASQVLLLPCYRSKNLYRAKLEMTAPSFQMLPSLAKRVSSLRAIPHGPRPRLSDSLPGSTCRTKLAVVMTFMGKHDLYNTPPPNNTLVVDKQ